jgi:hypothetical protein
MKKKNKLSDFKAQHICTGCNGRGKGMDICEQCMTDPIEMTIGITPNYNFYDNLQDVKSSTE